ncbi:MAG: ABC transporter permease [Bacteroidota bacterium]
MSKVGLIIRREYFTRVKKKSFIIMTILGPLLFVGITFLAVFLSQQESGTTQVLVSDPDNHFAVLDSSFLKNTESVKYHREERSFSEKEFNETPYDLMIELLDAEDISNKDIPLVYKESGPSMNVSRKISNDLERAYQDLIMQSNEMTKDDIDRLIAKVNLVENKVFEDVQEVPRIVGAVVGFIFSLIIYMFIFIYGTQIMRSVMEEKSTRIVEVIISSVKPFQLMMGKIIGVAMVALTQVIIWIVFYNVLMLIFSAFFPDIYTGGGQMAMAQDMLEEVNPNQMAEKIYQVLAQINFPFLIGMFLFYFLGGYLLYGSLFAAIGGAVDHDTDSQQFMLPITIPLVFGFILAEMAISNPDGPAVWWASIIPFTSPIVMMVKVGMMGMGFIPIEWGTIALSMFLLVAGFVFTTWMAGKIYRTGILMYGKKVNYKEIWKWLTYKV